MPHPTWTRVENVHIPETSISKAADLLRAQLGPEGIEAIGGTKWWLWRRKNVELQGEWIEMRSDYNKRTKTGSKGRRIMMYIHGGAYFFGSVDEHRYQMQRHARKLNARVFAPRYRLAPQFPFPCGLLDCLAAYLYLLTMHEANEIIFAGDSAGGGMVLSLLCILRDQRISMPAGAVLISPWVDLTHSFPSLSREDELDYIPAHGFMQKPSHSWPPPTEQELKELVKELPSQRATATENDEKPPPPQRVDTFEAAHRARKLQPPLSLQLDGEEFLVREQIQLYTTNQLIGHPLVSPVLQPSLGGLPPLLIMVGGGERLRDEQIFIGHKAADPQAYKLSEHWRKLYDPEDKILKKYRPTPVQLQVWEDLCHVTPTLSFTRPAKFMYRAVAQFGAWALSRAQNRSIEIIVEDDSSSSTSSTSDDDDDADPKTKHLKDEKMLNSVPAEIGKAGDPLPAFKNNMIRQQVDRHGMVNTLPKATDLPALQVEADLIGMVKEGPIRNWVKAKKDWDTRYASTRRRIHKERLEAVREGKTRAFGEGESPPPTSLAGRLHDVEGYTRTQKLKKSWGLGMWSSWGWKHDEKRVQSDEKLDKRAEVEGRRRPSQSQEDLQDQSTAIDDTESSTAKNHARPRAGSRVVSAQDEGQIEGDFNATQNPKTKENVNTGPTLLVDPAAPADSNNDGLSPTFIPKWRTAMHLRNESREISDAGSTYSNASRIVPDDASTRAVFSAAGVNKQYDGVASTPTSETRTFDLRTTTPAGFRDDNLGGYDTPHSQRSVERLHDHQADMVDGRSVHSSLAVSTVDRNDVRSSAIRSPSSMAVVRAEGVIDAVEPERVSVSVAQQIHTTALSSGHSRTLTEVQSSTPNTQQEQEAESGHASMQRPALYDRSDTKFVTANEVI